MAELTRWIREYELVFSGPTKRIVISSLDQRDPLDISFDVTYDPQFNGQGTLNLSVFGLRESTVAEIIQPGVKVWLSVGYRGQQLKFLFAGGIRKAWVEESDTQHELKIMALSSRIGSKPLPITVSGPETNYNIGRILINALNRSIPELVVDEALNNLRDIQESEPKRSDLEKFELDERTLLADISVGSFTLSDTGLESVQKFFDTFNIKMLVVNDTLYLVRKGGNLNTSKAVQAVLGDNLLRPPRKRLDNMASAPDTINTTELYELSLLLEPSIVPNSVIISSHQRVDTGSVEEKSLILKVIEVRHSGKYRGNEWYTEIAGTPASSFISKVPIRSTAFDVKNSYEEPKYFKSGGSFRGAGATGSF